MMKTSKRKKDNNNVKKIVLTYQNKIASESFIFILVVLGITLPIHFNCELFDWFWVIFVWVALFVPVGLINLKVGIESRNNFTNEQKKNASAKIGIIILWYWFLDFVYLSIFNNWIVLMYASSIIAIIVIFYNLAVSFVNRKINNSFYNGTLIVDLLIGVGLTIFLIFKIQNDTLQTIATNLVASLFGGLITLLGVAWTINENNQSKKNDEIQKAKPLFGFNMIRKEPDLSTIVERVCFPQKTELDFKCEVYCQIENSNKNSFIMTQIYHDGFWTKLEGNVNVLPSSKFILAFNFNDSPKSIYLEIEDEMNFKHFYRLSVLCLGTKGNSDRYFHTIRGIEPIDFKEVK